MSPANSDDASGAHDAGAARPLTRKEIREREKHLNDGPGPELQEGAGPAVPPQPSAPPATAGIPAVPDALPSIQDAHHDDAAHSDQYGQPDPAYADPADREPAYAVHHQQQADAHPDSTYDDGAHHGAGSQHSGDHHDAHHLADAQHADEHHELLPGSAAVQVVAKPSRKIRRRRRFLALLITLAVFVAAVAVGAQFLKPLLGSDQAADFPGPGSGEVQVTVDNGEGTRSVAADLESKRVVANADTFLQAFAASGGVLAPGDYTFKAEMKNTDAVDVLLGKSQAKVIYIALSAGLRVGESLQAIADGSGVTVQQLQAFNNAPAQFGLPATAKNLEGYLAPGEYRFPLGTPAKEILQKLVSTTVDELKSQGITDPAKQYEAVTVASIVQAEGGQAEYGDVAGAIYNRLKPNDQTGGFLQVDSAVTYGLGTKSFNFTDEERKDKSNLYNTYANPGLPPGPIGSPGKTAIDAAAKPKANDYLYWVTVNLDTKETKFSRTLAEHNVFVEQYNTWCMANAGRCT
ncbi:endolytic transglycosylase MltG [Arthrobacter sp. G.S.26]|uniref:endolytic transglycosylase MltG n=1 Tax=Arthrobacter sp. G.S.26 TaxID=3433706 RepID=UPI003D773C18